MKIVIILHIFLLAFMSPAVGNPVSIDIFQIEDKTKIRTIEQILDNPSWAKVGDISTLNFGLPRANYWLKIVVKNTLPDATYKLMLSTIVPDTIEVYYSLKSGVLNKELIGEAIPSNERFLNYYFKPNADTPSVIYLKIMGDEQPIALHISIERSDMGSNTNLLAALFSGLLYGIVCFILIINLVLFISNREKLYLYFCFFNVFCTGVIAYFDGLVKLLLIPNSIYWNNEFIAIALCGSFISINYYFQELLEIKSRQPALMPYFTTVNCAYLLIGGLSFWHPTGFVWYIKLQLILTSGEALLLLISLILARHNEKTYLIVQFVSIGLVIVFGSITQLYFLGFLPINFLTRYAVHFMILPQVFIQTYALFRRFTLLTEERLAMQATLLKSSEQYSQSLINTL